MAYMYVTVHEKQLTFINPVRNSIVNCVGLTSECQLISAIIRHMVYVHIIPSNQSLFIKKK